MKGNKLIDTKTRELMLESGLFRKVGRFVFKAFRIWYASWIFYFLPYTSLFLPYVYIAKYIVTPEAP